MFFFRILDDLNYHKTMSNNIEIVSYITSDFPYLFKVKFPVCDEYDNLRKH